MAVRLVGRRSEDTPLIRIAALLEPRRGHERTDGGFTLRLVVCAPPAWRREEERESAADSAGAARAGAVPDRAAEPDAILISWPLPAVALSPRVSCDSPEGESALT